MFGPIAVYLLFQYEWHRESQEKLSFTIARRERV